ncbi:extracellular solute-binding protein [Aureibacillus halotolerans]|uniref:Carbohydrate ABC transporter substrate-binding protein (CUT1 family) n=1 Tax=Aureibacillus halotolerans TaxID=1508390 RepID=A0A4R6U809_9BACI|nr:extracellular solute-binding protein [Aureibacillus halotolerans]TDQ42690.1 carbohydrate ABC transporter substrate-binding protein (CUT1 family) [Aureibacillus halotolerans]
MTSYQRIVGLVGAAILLAVTGCSNSGGAGPREATTNEAGDIVLELARPSYTDTRPPSDELWIFQELQKKTGVDITWDEINRNSLGERKNIMMASKDLPDAFYQIGFSNDELLKYGKQGLFIPLEDLIEEHAPNIKKMLDENPEIRKAITQSDGHIYSLPYVDHSHVFRSIRLYVNQKWLDNLGLEKPETVEEFVDVLRAFRDEDANGNGDPTDEQGWSMASGTLSWSLMHQLLGSYGLGNGGSPAIGQYIYLDENNEVQPLLTDERYKEVFTLLQEMYKEGLIGKTSFSGLEYGEWVNQVAADQIGAFSWENPYYSGDKTEENYIGIHALEGPYGDRVMSWVDPAVRGTSSFTITSKNPYPEESMKWVDFFYSEEGSNFAKFGEEGVTYEMVDGMPRYSDEILNHPEGAQMGAFQFIDNLYGGYWPYLEPKDTWRAAALGDDLTNRINADPEEAEAYLPETIISTFTPTADESGELDAITTDINTFMEEMRTKFITGELDIEAEWENYVNTLKQMGYDRLIEIRKEQYERYQSS